MESPGCPFCGSANVKTAPRKKKVWQCQKCNTTFTGYSPHCGWVKEYCTQEHCDGCFENHPDSIRRGKTNGFVLNKNLPDAAQKWHDFDEERVEWPQSLANFLKSCGD